MDIFELIEKEIVDGRMPERWARQMEEFYRSYLDWRRSRNLPTEHLAGIFQTYWELVRAQCAEPYIFEPYHPATRAPFDYYQFGVDIIRGVIDEEHSTTTGLDQARRMEEQIAAGHNVVLLANHQTECDPQILSILLEKDHPQLAEKMIFVAGERVTTDPLAVPYSLGRHLLCIYSKRHMDHPPEQRAEKLAHNTRVMKVLHQLLTEGGKVIYVAPSGGRDRPSASGKVRPAPFDPAAVEMFRMMASRTPNPCHFYPLALYSYPILPPPESVEEALGEHRLTHGGPVHLAFGKELNLDHLPGAQIADRHLRRQRLAEYAWEQVNGLYLQFPQIRAEERSR
jgi:glycerol-3-phosphate O-acyltransferase